MISNGKKIYDAILDFIFPRRCPVCDGVVKYGSFICRECRPLLIKVKEPRCYTCGRSLKNSDYEYCIDCQNKHHKYDKGLALYEYNSVCNSIYKFKYKERAEYGDYFSREMALSFKSEIKKWNADAIIPVPLHKRKQRARGYNQAAILAKSLSDYLNIPYFPQIVIRKRNTLPLKELDPESRQINLENAFIIRLDGVKLNRVIIVDDIYTTGTTIDEIAGLLKKNNVQKVFFLTLAIGIGV